MFLQAGDLAKAKENFWSVGFGEAELFQYLLKNAYKVSDTTQNSWFGTELA